MRIVDNEIEFVPAQFGYVNPEARVVLVGITPGNTQLVASRVGKSLREIKRESAFAGCMRSNLVMMLDKIGVNGFLGIPTCTTLWCEDFDKVDMTSLLIDATYYKGKMFNKAVAILGSEKLREALNDGFVRNCAMYKNVSLFVAMGSGVWSVLNRLQEEGVIKANIVAIPHPSGANAGRIAVFLGAKTGLDRASLRAQEQFCQAARVVGCLCSKYKNEKG